MQIEQIKAWAVLMYHEVDQELDCYWVMDQLEQREKIETCEAIDNPV